MLRRVGIMWTTDALEPAAEHFISNLVRQKLFTVIDSLPAVKALKDSWLLFLPENEFHEIGLLFANFLIRQSGRKVIYLGANVPLESLFITVKETSPQQVLLFLTHNDLPDETQDYLDELSLFFGDKKVFVAADHSLFETIKVAKNIHWLVSPGDLEKELSQINV